MILQNSACKRVFFNGLLRAALLYCKNEYGEVLGQKGVLMKKSLFQSTGRFYKANLHAHTNVSDGKLTPEEAKEAYKACGYEILAYTDHEVLVPHPELQDEHFLPLTGTEYQFNNQFGAFRDPATGEVVVPPKYITRKMVYHVIFLAPKADETYYPWPSRGIVWGNAKEHMQDYFVGEKPRSSNPSIINAAIRDAKEHGFLTTLCHPFWSMNRYADYAALENLDFVETYNSACEIEGYALDNSERPFDDLLSLKKKVFPTCSDDSHSLFSVGRAATYVKAPELSYDAVFQSLSQGDVFATTGPLFKDISFDPETCILSVETSPVRLIMLTSSLRFARRVGDRREGTVTSAEFDLHDVIDALCRYDVPEDHFFRLTLIDEGGYRAYSRGYFIPELFA